MARAAPGCQRSALAAGFAALKVMKNINKIKSGVHLLGVGLRMALEQRAGWVLLKADLANALNTFSRAAVLDTLELDVEGEVADVFPLFRSSLADKSMIILGNQVKSIDDFDLEDGVQQSSEGPVGFCLGLHADLVDADQQLSPYSGRARV